MVVAWGVIQAVETLQHPVVAVYQFLAHSIPIWHFSDEDTSGLQTAVDFLTDP